MKDDKLYLLHISECIEKIQSWNIVEREIPKLESQVEAILKGIKEESK